MIVDCEKCGGHWETVTDQEKLAEKILTALVDNGMLTDDDEKFPYPLILETIEEYEKNIQANH